ncbi:MAG TPA: ParB N-terminal domain-containing protein [Vampirovibrionales bacterium]
MHFKSIKIANIIANEYHPTPTEECQIDDLAQSIVQLEGLVRPLIVTQVFPKLYQVMETSGLRFAAVKWAAQISGPTSINCLVMTEDEAAAIATQLKAE